MKNVDEISAEMEKLRMTIKEYEISKTEMNSFLEREKKINQELNLNKSKINQLNAKIVMDNGGSINIKMLISLINDAKFIIANDTGPAHIASHLKKKGLVLFGSHTSAEKVSIESSDFRAITVKNLSDLDVDTVMKEVRTKLN